MKGRAVYRWERDEAVPSRRNLAALVTALRAVSQEVATWLEREIANDGNDPAAVAPAPPPVDELAVVEHAVYAMADELDLPPPPGASRATPRDQAPPCDKLTLDTTENRLDEWIAASSS